jgi:capsular polysaccharide transport system permease protein
LKKRASLVLLFLAALLPAYYYLFVASDMYVSYAKFAIRGQKSVDFGGLISLLGGGATNVESDSYIVVEYIGSMDMLKRVEEKLNWVEHYSQDSADFFSRLSGDASLEQRLEYWNSITVASYDSQTNILTVEVRAFDPAMAQAVVQVILEGSEDLMNTMNDRIKADTILLARKEVEAAEIRYAAAKKALNALRAVSAEIDPKATASSRLGIIAGLEAQLSKLNVELHTRQEFMTSTSFPIRTLVKSIGELEAQLDLEKAKLTGDSGPEMLALLEKYEALSIENEFARNLYTSSLSALEAAKVQSEGKSIYLEAFESPLLPDQAMYPKRISFALLSIVVVIMGYALILFTIAAVKEHIGV